MQIKGKVVIITGSGQGLGRAFAVRLLEHGARVCLSDYNLETGSNTLKELSARFGEENVHFIKCDVTKEEELKSLYDGCETHFKSKVDIFCNNAGINHIPGWKKCMDIDIMAVICGTELAVDRMDIRKGGKGGLIVNTASLAGIGIGMSRESASYFIAKHGVVSLTRTYGQAKVVKDTGVKVQCICPAFTDTGILTDLEPDQKKMINKKFGIMTPEFVADAFIHLIKDGESGAAICIMKDAPPFYYEDFSREWVTVLVVVGKILQKLFGIQVLTARHQLGFALFSFLVLQFLIYLLLL